MTSPTGFNKLITADGSSGLKSEAGRYHLYVALSCPNCTRVLIARKLKGLEDVVSLTVLDPVMGKDGWKFSDKIADPCSPDPCCQAEALKDLYLKADPEYSDRSTVPVLWDKRTNTLLNNDSAEITRMLITEFNDFCATPEQRDLDLYPEDKKAEIQELESWIGRDINRGVYQVAFSQTQDEYDERVKIVFNGLEKAEKILSKRRYLTGNSLAEVDIWLFATCLRFDTIYYPLFRCNIKRLQDYPNLWNYTKDIFQMKNISEVYDREQIKIGYEANMKPLNPKGIISGPYVDFNAPHDRDKYATLE